MTQTLLDWESLSWSCAQSLFRGRYQLSGVDFLFDCEFMAGVAVSSGEGPVSSEQLPGWAGGGVEAHSQTCPGGILHLHPACLDFWPFWGDSTQGRCQTQGRGLLHGPQRFLPSVWPRASRPALHRGSLWIRSLADQVGRGYEPHIRAAVMGLWVVTDGHWTLDKSSPSCVDVLLGHIPPGCRENCAGQDRVSGPRSQWCEIPYSHPWGQCGPPRQGRWGCCHQAQGPRIVPKGRRRVTAPWARASASSCWAQPHRPSGPCSPQPALQPQPLRALWRLSWPLQARGDGLQAGRDCKVQGPIPVPLLPPQEEGVRGKRGGSWFCPCFRDLTSSHLLLLCLTLGHSLPAWGSPCLEGADVQTTPSQDGTVEPRGSLEVAGAFQGEELRREGAAGGDTPGTWPCPPVRTLLGLRAWHGPPPAHFSPGRVGAGL